MSEVSRTRIYEDFNKHKRQRDARSMDIICDSSEDSEFKLQAQQQFLRDYVTQNPDWDRLMLYHQIGSGKTCTAITIAEAYLKQNPAGRVTVVLPARLRTNFFDELISPCGSENYLSKEDFKSYHDPATSSRTKAQISRAFMKAVEAKYEVMSFEKFKKIATKAPNLRDWAKDFTKDRLIIVDEAHNLMSDLYRAKEYEKIAKTGIFKRNKGANSMLFKYLATHKDSSCKLLLLTATPIFDNLGQLKQVVEVMNPNQTVVLNSKTNIKAVIEALRGRVSFFPGTSPNAYPQVRYQAHDIPMSKVQTKVIETLRESDDDNADDEDNDAFMSKERQASLACLPGREPISKNIQRVLSDPKMHCPKIAKLLAEIKRNKGKHLVFSTFVKSGVNVVKAALEAAGWVDLNAVYADSKAWAEAKNRVFCIWDGSVKDQDKVKIKSIVNKKDNMDGRRVRVIIGSPSIREGVSFKHIQHMHLMDPVWNASAKTQVEGRAIRFCSHSDIPKDHPFLKREVCVHVYKLVAPKGWVYELTADQEIYDGIIPRKAALVREGEAALKKVAIDYYLFREMYTDKTPPPPPKHNPIIKSPVSIPKSVLLEGRKVRKIKNTCPKLRRPSENDECPEGHVMRVNPQKHKCCYKIRGNGVEPEKPKTQAASCPKPRRPDAKGNCPEGFAKRINHHGHECCYKIRGSSAFA
jgi:hypothetical protein